MVQDSTKQIVRTIILSKRVWLIDNTMGLVLWKIFSWKKNRGNGKSSVPFFSPMPDQNVISSVWKIRTYDCNKNDLPCHQQISLFVKKWFNLSFQQWFPSFEKTGSLKSRPRFETSRFEGLYLQFYDRGQHFHFSIFSNNFVHLLSQLYLFHVI